MSHAFDDVPVVKAGIDEATVTVPSLRPLFSSISNYVLKIKAENNDLKRRLMSQDSTSSDPATKKRKIALDGEKPPVSSTNNLADPNIKADCVVADISFSIPVRKKLRLEIVKGLGGFRGLNQSTGDVEVSMSWEQLDQIFLVPVPEKSQPQWNFIATPLSTHPALAPSDGIDSVVWTVSSVLLGASQLQLADGSRPDPSTRLVDFLEGTINACLAPLGKRVMTPTASEFVSEIVQAHRKDEKAFHVKAFRGSKDGFLYFLPCGIIFGFRKPILYFPFASITSISYSSILQRTFNLTISASPFDTRPASNGAARQPEQDIEFSMLDQQDYQGIDEFVKRHGLNNASLAQSRRAQHYNVNRVKSEPSANGDTNGAPPEDEQSELAKAEQALQDAEDEEEEDYDPGSEGDSDGSGSDSEEEEDAGGGGEEDGADYDEADDNDEAMEH